MRVLDVQGGNDPVAKLKPPLVKRAGVDQNFFWGCYTATDTRNSQRMRFVWWRHKCKNVSGLSRILLHFQGS